MDMSKLLSSLLAALIVLAGAGAMPAWADDWVAAKLRGPVLRLVDADWVKLQRGDVVADDDVIRTMAGGWVQFSRDSERIDLGPNTQIQIFDKTGQRFTTVKQYFGTVSVEANVEKVQHFAVETPYLAAVVKGTKFIVTSGESGATVLVTRGQVAVEDSAEHHRTLLGVRQQAAATAAGQLTVSGEGDLPEIYDTSGVVPAGATLVDGQPLLNELGLPGDDDEDGPIDAGWAGPSVGDGHGGLPGSANPGGGNPGNGNSGGGNPGNGNSGGGNPGGGGNGGSLLGARGGLLGH